MKDFNYKVRHRYLISTQDERYRCKNSKMWIQIAFYLAPVGTKLIDLSDLKIVLAK